MHLTYLKLLGFFVCAVVFQTCVNASIIVSFVDKTVLNSTTASFEVYASADSGSHLIGGYGFTLTLNQLPVSALTATQVTPVPVGVGATDTKWSGLHRVPGGPGISANSVTFQGGGPPTGGLNLDPYNVLIASGQSTNSLIGTVSFVRDLFTTYTISTVATSTLRTDLPNNGLGFLTAVNVPDDIGGVTPSAVAVSSSFNPFSITAVPEPSTMALVGIAVGGFGLKKLRSRRKRQAKML